MVKQAKRWGRTKLESIISSWQQKQRDGCRHAVLSLLEENESAKVLDLGVGSGDFIKDIGRRVRTNYLYGIDIREQSVRQAAGKGTVTLRADLNEPLPLQDESFDVLHGYEVMEELTQIDTFVKEIYRLLKCGGYAVIVTPNLAYIFGILFLLLGWQPTALSISRKVILGNPISRGMAIADEHRANKSAFTYSGLVDLFRYYGFIVEKVVGVGYFLFPNRISAFLSLIDPRHCNRLVIKVRKPIKVA